MHLKKMRVRNFRCIDDTGEFDLDDLTCLVGKNEAGKSAVLDALYGLNPYRPFSYDKTRDYPRRYLAKFDQYHTDGKSEVVKTWWSLSDDDCEAIEEELGGNCIKDRTVTVSNGIGFDGRVWGLNIDEEKCIENAVESLKLNATERSQIGSCKSTSEVVQKLSQTQEKSEKLQNLQKKFESFRSGRATLKAIDILQERMPKFFLTSHYDRMSGEISLRQLQEDRKKDEVSPGDQIFLDFIEYAGTTIEELQDVSRYEELVGICEAASSDITDEIFQFWSQNEALSVAINLGEGKPDDPPPFDQGTIVKIRIWNDHHRASVPLSERSAGFVWFFSFLSQFKQLVYEAGGVILLLDEPGLTLHGKAQADLLRYIDERLLENHQVIYTTHSPFMVPANKLAKVRVVEDVLQYPQSGRGKPAVLGTKVSSEILSVDGDTLFPLRGHLGYEITQTLFIGENTLLVEGPSDILYIQAASHALARKDRESLDEKWTICPTGGIDKVQTFAALFSGNNLNIAVLTDYSKGDRSKLEKLRQSEILHTSRIYTATDFTGKDESDIEDFFHPRLYADIVNQSFALEGKSRVTGNDLVTTGGNGRIVKAAEAAFRLMPADHPEFSHFAPSAHLLRNSDLLLADTEEVRETLDRFEKAFHEINALL